MESIGQLLTQTQNNMCTKIHCTNRWWLRSPGGDTDGAAYVYPDGSVDYYGGYVVSADSGVRPALWVKY